MYWRVIKAVYFNKRDEIGRVWHVRMRNAYNIWNTCVRTLNVHGVHDVRHTETHTAEPLVPEPSAFEVELAVEKHKSHKSPGIDQIPAELIKEGGRKTRYQIHKLIVSIWNKEELPVEWKESIIVPIHKKGIKQIVITIGAYHFCQLRTKYCPTSFSQG